MVLRHLRVGLAVILFLIFFAFHHSPSISADSPLLCPGLFKHYLKILNLLEFNGVNISWNLGSLVGQNNGLMLKATIPHST